MFPSGTRNKTGDPVDLSPESRRGLAGSKTVPPEVKSRKCKANRDTRAGKQPVFGVVSALPGQGLKFQMVEDEVRRKYWQVAGTLREAPGQTGFLQGRICWEKKKVYNIITPEGVGK